MADMFSIIALGIGLLGLLIGVASLFAVRTLGKRLRSLMRGQKDVNLEDVLRGLGKTVDALTHGLEDATHTISHHGKLIEQTIRGVGIVKFNAFPDTGGSQSFAIALVSSEGNGVILSSLVARDRTSVFAKPISVWKASVELTPEETRALASAREQLIT